MKTCEDELIVADCLRPSPNNEILNMSNATNTTEAATKVIVNEGNLKRIPVKFTVLVVSNINDPSNFKGAMLAEFKSLLSVISSYMEGVKFTNVNEHYMPRILQERDVVSSFHFYYDVTVVLSDASANPGNVLIKAVQQYHTIILQKIQEYKSTNYYYMEDFELCTPSNGGTNVDESMFDLCSYDHQLVSAQIEVVGLPSDLNIDRFNEDIIGVFQGILSDVGGLVVAGVYADELKERGDIIEFFYDIDILQRENRNMKSVVTTKLESEDTKDQISNRIQAHTSQEVCITDEGRYSLEPCVSTRSRQMNMPTWQIIAITVAILVLLFTFFICIGLIRRQRRKEREEFNDEVGEFRRGRHVREDKRKRRHREPRRHSSGRERGKDDRRKHHRPEKRRHHSERRHRRRRTEESADPFCNEEPL